MTDFTQAQLPPVFRNVRLRPLADRQTRLDIFVSGCPERSFIESQICRAEARMNSAKSSKWAHLWCGLMVRKINARNAMRSVAEVRQLERERGLR